MARLSNKQIALRPQDLVLMLKLALSGRQRLTYASYAMALFMSPSEVHAGIRRCQLARLVNPSDQNQIEVNRSSLKEFVLSGARYAFPPAMGSLTRGTATAYAGPYLREQIIQPNEPPPVWPYSRGSSRGVALVPLYPTVPQAVEKDPQLYESLSLFDAIRIGAARERELATARLGLLLS